MGYPTKVQLIRRKASEQWYINFPAALAQAMEFERGEVVEWVIEDKASLRIPRQAEHRFHGKANTHSAPSRTPIPREGEH